MIDPVWALFLGGAGMLSGWLVAGIADERDWPLGPTLAAAVVVALIIGVLGGLGAPR